MANNYSQATLEPCVHLTEDQQKLVRATCGNYDNVGQGQFYVYWDESFDEDSSFWLESLHVSDEEFAEWEKRVQGWSLPHLLRWILQNPENSDIESLTFEGANTCSKMRPGEFGGFCLVVTRSEYCWLNTQGVNVKDGKIVVSPPEVQQF